MIYRLPRWVWLGGWLLAFVGGMVNVTAMLAFGQTVSHVTGTTSNIGIAAASGDVPTLLRLGGVLLAFVVGAAVSGALIDSPALQLGRPYGFILLLESLLLFAATLFFERHQWAGVYLAAGACGLQNAMASTYSGAIIRTTHVTGLFTDVGTLIGRALRGERVERRRLALFATLLTGFTMGCVAAAVCFTRLGPLTLLVPASIAAMLAATYQLSKRFE